MNRRDFLKISLMGLAQLALWRTRSVFGAEREEKAIVIGAGIAGLSVARALKSYGFQVTVLEARERAGGRVWTDRSLGKAVDMGASWIHGLDGNPVTKLAADFKAPHVATDYDNIAVYGASGGRVAEAVLREAEKEFAAARRHAEALSETLDADVSVGAALDRALKDRVIPPEQKPLWDWMRASLEVEAAAELDELSLQADEDDGFDGGDHLFPEGYDQIVRGLSAGLDIRYGHAVTQIETSAKGARVTTSRGVFEGDGAVVTLPLGVLKAGAVRFVPELPERKRRAIARLGMGVLNKVALKFPKAFWPQEHEFLCYASATRGEFPEFLNMQKALNEPVLVAFTGGDFARSIEALGDREAATRATAVLRKMFGSSVPEPVAVAVSRWVLDPFAGGSYSHVAVGGTADDYDALAEPAGERLFFAGEATIRDYPGTVHGAYLSGLREARRIAAL